MTGKKIAVRAALFALAALLLACLTLLPPPAGRQTLAAVAFRLGRYVLQVSALIVWCSSLYRRIVNIQVRRVLIAAGGLMVFWLASCAVRYEFVADSAGSLVRYLWYCYYIPVVLIPLLGVVTVFFLGRPADYRLPGGFVWLVVPAVLLLLAVFTNDLHQLVFRFPGGGDYRYGILYAVLMGWVILQSLYFVILLLKKNRVPGSRRWQLLPLFILVAAVIFWVLYSALQLRVDLAALDCVIIVALLESAIQSGMIPSNSSYRQLFAKTTLPVQIVDKHMQTHYASHRAQPLSREDLEKTCAGAVRLGDTLLRSAPIHGGRVVWQDDISEQSRLTERLQDVREQLSEEKTLLQAEVELQSSRAKTDEKNRLYDRIARETSAQLIKAEGLLKQLEREPESTCGLLGKLCVLGSYIKRRGNLLLLGEADSRVRGSELEYCLRESLDSLRFAGIFTLLNSSCAGELTLERIIQVYDLFETLVERLPETVTALLVNLTCEKGSLCLSLQLNCREEVARALWEDLQPGWGSITCSEVEGDAVICLRAPEGGAAQ